MEEALKKLYDAVLEGDFEGVETNLQASLDAKLAPAVIPNDGMIAAMREAGARFEAGEYYVPEMLIAARAMQSEDGISETTSAKNGQKIERQGCDRHCQRRPA